MSTVISRNILSIRKGEEIEVTLTPDQISLLEDGNVIPIGNETIYLLPFIFAERDGKFYVKTMVGIDSNLTDEQAGSLFEDPTRIKYTLN